MDFGLLYENDKREYEVFNDVRIADIRLVSLIYLLVYFSMYCVPIPLLRQNKPFPLLYLGHAQIIIHSMTQSKGLLGGHKQTGRWNGRLKLTILGLTYSEQTTKFPAHSALLKQ